MGIHPSDQHERHGSSDSGWGALTRLAWMLFGALAIGLTLLSIATVPAWQVGLRDAALVLFLGGTLWARYVDITRFAGTTANGAPASLADFRRYSVALLLVTAGGWVLAHSIEV